MYSANFTFHVVWTQTSFAWDINFFRNKIDVNGTACVPCEWKTTIITIKKLHAVQYANENQTAVAASQEKEKNEHFTFTQLFNYELFAPFFP